MARRIEYVMKVCEIAQVGRDSNGRVSDITLDAASDKTACKLTHVSEHVACTLARHLYRNVRVTIEIDEV